MWDVNCQRTLWKKCFRRIQRRLSFFFLRWYLWYCTFILTTLGLNWFFIVKSLFKQKSWRRIVFSFHLVTFHLCQCSELLMTSRLVKWDSDRKTAWQPLADSFFLFLLHGGLRSFKHSCASEDHSRKYSCPQFWNDNFLFHLLLRDFYFPVFPVVRRSKTL